jgi:hypothetical protein
VVLLAFVLHNLGRKPDSWIWKGNGINSSGRNYAINAPNLGVAIRLRVGRNRNAAESNVSKRWQRCRIGSIYLPMNGLKKGIKSFPKPHIDVNCAMLAGY